MSDPDRGAPESGRVDAAVERATALTQRTLALFPVRVWRHFLQHNGFLLAAGVSYQALFAIFAAIYLAFADHRAVARRQRRGRRRRDRHHQQLHTRT